MMPDAFPASTRARTRAVLDYFRAKAGGYDEVDSQSYWRLSDALLWDVLADQVLEDLPSGFQFLDAGGGTGRWARRLLEADPQCHGQLLDLSPEMLAVAAEKGRRSGWGGRLQLRQGSIEAADPAWSGQSYDLIINLHNVLGFVPDPETALRILVSCLKPGGCLASFVPNKYHMIFFNLYLGRLPEAESCARLDQGTFTPDMPAIHAFTPAGLAGLYDRVGLELAFMTGFPCAVYPGSEETRLQGSTPRLTALLDQPEPFRRVFALERQLLREQGIAPRGNNLLALGRRPGGPLPGASRTRSISRI